MTGDLPCQKIYALKQGAILVAYFTSGLPLLPIFIIRMKSDLNWKNQILLLNLADKRCILFIGGNLVAYLLLKEVKKVAYFLKISLKNCMIVV